MNNTMSIYGKLIIATINVLIVMIVMMTPYFMVFVGIQKSWVWLSVVGGILILLTKPVTTIIKGYKDSHRRWLEKHSF